LKPLPRIEKRLLTAKQAGEYLSVAEWTIRQWASMGRLPKVKLGRSLRFGIEDLDKLIEEEKIPRRDLK
jgi:excisionase family DNA binding protein